MLDLRGNGGGLLLEAVAVSSLFIEDGEIVSVRGRNRTERTHDAEGDAILPEDVPVVHARGRRQRERLRDRHRRAARPRARDRRRHAHVRQGPGAGGRAALERRRPRPDRGELLPARAARRSPPGASSRRSGPRTTRTPTATRRSPWRSTRSFASFDERRGPGPAERAGSTSRWWLCSRSAAASSWRSRSSARGRGPPSTARGAGAGDLVLVGGGKRGARVLRRIGRPDRARDVVEGLMLDRGLHRSYARAASAEAELSAARAVRGRRARGPPRPADVHHRPGRREGLRRRDLGPPRAARPRPRLGAHRGRDRVRAAGRAARARGLQARHERVRAGRGRADAAGGAVEPRPARSGPGRTSSP